MRLSKRIYIYIYIDKCHISTNRLENVGLNSNSLEKTLHSNAPESKRASIVYENVRKQSLYSVMRKEK